MPPASPTSSQRGRRSNVSQACINCRQRKKKCDGRTPICSTCESYKDDCVWTNKTDWRKNVSRAEANGLRARIAELEAMLQAQSAPRPPDNSFTDVPKGYTASSSASHSDVTRPYSGTSVAPPSRPPLPAPSGLWEPLPKPPTASGSMPTSAGDSSRPKSSRSRYTPRDSGFDHQYNSLVTPERDDEDDVEVLMVQDNRGRIRVHGPSSAFRHENAEDHTTTSSSSPGQRLATTQRPPFAGSDTDAWKRYLPDFFLTRAQHDVAIDRFFRYFAAWAQRCTPHLFYRDMDIALWTEQGADLAVVAPNYSPFLHNVILSIGLAFMDEEHLRDIATRRVFVAEADKFLDQECANPSVATAQGLAIKGSFYSTMGNYSVGWVNQGISGRLCYALGLHLNTAPLVSRGKLSREANVQRNVTFWSWYCQEVLWAIYIGRNPMLQEYTLPPMTADPVTDETLWTWPPGPRETLPPQKSYLSLGLVYTIPLCQIALEVQRTIHSGRADKFALVDSGAIQRFSDRLDNYLSSLPGPLQVSPMSNEPTLPHVLMINMAWAWTVIVLYQPFSQIVSRERDIATQYQNIGTLAMTRGHQAAIMIVQLAAMWNDQHSLRFTPPTLTTIIYSAGTTFLLAAAQASNEVHATASLRKVHTCLEYLQEIGKTWEAGRQLAVILQDLVTDVAHASLEVPTFMGDMQRGWRHTDGRGGVSTGERTSQESATGSLDPSPSAYQPAAWSEDAGFDQFIASLLSQNTNPIAGTAHLVGLEGFV